MARRYNFRESWCPEAILISTALAMVLGFAEKSFAQYQMSSQDGINATLFATQNSFEQRLAKMEGLLEYSIIGVFGNLGASLLHMLYNRKQRQS